MVSLLSVGLVDGTRPAAVIARRHKRDLLIWKSRLNALGLLVYPLFGEVCIHSPLTPAPQTHHHHHRCRHYHHHRRHCLPVPAVACRCLPLPAAPTLFPFHPAVQFFPSPLSLFFPLSTNLFLIVFRRTFCFCLFSIMRVMILPNSRLLIIAFFLIRWIVFFLVFFSSWYQFSSRYPFKTDLSLPIIVLNTIYCMYCYHHMYYLFYSCDARSRL